MRSETIPSASIKKYFFLFLILHLIIWISFPILMRHNLPMDALEGAIWGEHLDWGYDKNPFLNAWLTAFAVYLDHYSGWMIYVFSQLTVVIGFYATWQLAKNILPRISALLTVVLLECIQYYNLHSIDFNDNTLELALWPLTILAFYHATKPNGDQKYLAWIATAFFAALAMMAKYFVLLLIASMFLFLLTTEKNRQHFKEPYFYLSIFTFILISLPHFLWLFDHDFVTVSYVFERAQAIPHWYNRLLYPIKFGFEQLITFLPALILFFIFYKKNRSTPQTSITFDQQFLLFMGLGPFLLLLLFSFIFSIHLRAGWGSPLLGLWPLMLYFFVKPEVSVPKLKIIFVTVIVFSIILGGGYCYSLIFSDKQSSANFPGKIIAKTLAKDWHDRFHTKLHYVAGPRWLSGNISFYSEDHPTVFMEWDKRRTTWIDLNDLKQKGGIFIWELSKNENLPQSVLSEFPELKRGPNQSFRWLRGKDDPLMLGIAYLAPLNRS